MPLSKHIVQPVKLSQVSLPDGVNDELEFVANSTVCNVLKQISSLGQLAGNVFEDVIINLSKLTERSKRLHERINKLNDDIQLMCNADEDMAVEIQTNKNPNFVSNKPNNSQVLNMNTIPPSLRLCYEQAETAPPLHEMDALRTDNKISMKLYSNPSFFFDLWSRKMLQEPQSRKKGRKKRSKSKPKIISKQPPQLVIQQTGVGCKDSGRDIDTNSISVSEQMNDSSQTKPNITQNASYAHPITANNHFPMNRPMEHMDNTTKVYGSTKADTISKPDFHPPPPIPPPDLMNNNHKLISMNLENGYNNNDPLDEPGLPLPPLGLLLNVQDRAQSPSNISVHSHDLPPPPIFDNKPAIDSGDFEPNSFPPPPPPPPPLLPPPPPQIAMKPGDQPPPPPPPPPPPIFNFGTIMKSGQSTNERTNTTVSSSITSTDFTSTTTGNISTNATNTTSTTTTTTKETDILKNSTINSNKQDDSQGPPKDLLSAIRAGFQLRNTKERQQPCPVKYSRNNSLSAIQNTPNDVQAIFEAVRRRRECMENNLSDEKDDSDSSDWDD